jgi:hypothetical protein
MVAANSTIVNNNIPSPKGNLHTIELPLLSSTEAKRKDEKSAAATAQ